MRDDFPLVRPAPRLFTESLMTVTHLQEGPDSPGSQAHSASPGRENGNPKPRKTLRWRGLVSVAALAAVALTYTQAVTRAADGDLDPTFGNGGKVLTGFRSPGFFGTDMAIQPDGKIVATNASQQNGLGIILTRHLPDGSLDPNFVTVNIDTPNLLAMDVALQNDGKILVGARNQDSFTGHLLRFNVDGTLDASFGSNGTVTLESTCDTIAIQPDGKIVVGGADFSPPNTPSDDGFIHFEVVRLNPDGSRDLPFGNGGGSVKLLQLGRLAEANSVHIQPDGRIVVAGLVFNDIGAEIVVVRFTADGSLDTTFDGDGIALTNFGGGVSFPVAATLQSDGKILVTSAYSAIGPAGPFRSVLARYNVDGSLDADFGTDGLVLLNLNPGAQFVRALALQADGKIVQVGGDPFTLLRFDTQGALDPTFGTNGVLTTPIEGGSQATDIAIQRDGRLVVIGRAGNDTAIIRYQIQPPAHTLTFFLHGRDIPGTVGGLTMNETAPPAQILIHVGRDPSWFSAPTLNGTFLAGSSVQVVLPCSFGLSLPKTVRLATTNPHGKDEQLLGQVTEGLRFCQTQTLTVPVATPATLSDRRLKLTIKSSGAIDLPLRLGSQTFLRVTNFAGTP